MRTIALILVAYLLAGCVAAVPYAVRRSVVHNDVVLVLQTNVLYRRYIPAGVRLRPNPDLLQAIHGKVVAGNPGILVFGDYSRALASGKEFTVDAGSIAHIPELKEETVGTGSE